MDLMDVHAVVLPLLDGQLHAWKPLDALEQPFQRLLQLLGILYFNEVDGAQTENAVARGDGAGVGMAERSQQVMLEIDAGMLFEELDGGLDLTSFIRSEEMHGGLHGAEDGVIGGSRVAHAL